LFKTINKVFKIIVFTWFLAKLQEFLANYCILPKKC